MAKKITVMMSAEGKKFEIVEVNTAAAAAAGKARVAELEKLGYVPATLAQIS